MRASAKTAFRLSKTAYLRYLRCPAEFWLEFHQPLLFPRKIDLEYEHLRQQGYAVEQLVKERRQFRADETRLIEFQRTFQTNEIASRSDIVVVDKTTGELEIYEIKASSSIKDAHIDDLAFQVIAAEQMGFTVRAAFAITINGDYIRRGKIDVEQLFNVTDVTTAVRLRTAGTEENIKAARAYLGKVPVPSLVDYCIDNKIDCRYIRLYFPDLPEYTVFDISYLKHEKRRELLRDGVIAITDVPDTFPLNRRQKLQVAVARSGEILIDHGEIARRFDTWEYPLQFLDYETFAYAIPQYDGVSPFQHMCFQFSLHTIDRPGAEFRHTGYLSHGDGNPARQVAEHLRDAMSGGIGTVFVWYEPFECGRNTEMGNMFPDLKPFFDELNAKTYDLMKIFSDDLYVDPKFKGKTSIKKVLPVLVPWLDYGKLGIGDGLTATIKWFRAAKWSTLSDAERLEIFNDLEEYCELDTLAMVEIYNVLRSLIMST